MEPRVMDKAQGLNLDELRHLFDQAPSFIGILQGPNHVISYANEAYAQIINHRQTIGLTIREAFPEVAGQGYFEILDQVYTTGKPFVGRESLAMLQRTPGGPLEPIYVDFVYQPLFDSAGRVTGIFIQGHDVTEQKRARDERAQHQARLEELVQARTKELEASQARLRHAQKLEAVGKLTGGVAHDFNNILQVIGGNLQLIERDVGANPRAVERVQVALTAVQRGAKLANQLLAFARRQPLEPRVFNMGRLVRNMDELLRRTLGEGIEIETVIAAGQWNSMADPHQMENAILNLAINARDAMEGVGKLTIETGNAVLDEDYARHADVKPGQFAMLAITDTGCGMGPQVKEHIFEPFFTTKPEGQGTGLGLAMVYGFVKQSGGHIAVYSEEGQGTTFRIYLPRAMQEETESPARSDLPVQGGDETILVVEDDDDVRETAVLMLKDLGYRVLMASDGEGALAILRSGIPIDLIFTDVVMPGKVRSPDLARQAKALLPHVQVLFTSGYTENAIVHGGRLDPGVHLLGKPYRREDLGRKVRQLLGNRGAVIAPASPQVTRGTVRVLLVEDEEDVRGATLMLLRQSGFTAEAVGSGSEALKRLEAARFNVLVTDLRLGSQSGAELARTAMARWPDLRVLLVSGRGDDPGVGAPLLRKPFSAKQLEDSIEALVRRPSQ